MTSINIRIPYEACPLCGAGCAGARQVSSADCSRHALFRPPLPRTLRWLGCAGCGHVFTDGYFGPEGLKLLFSAANPGQLPGDDIANTRAIAAPLVEAVTAARPGGIAAGRWLDVGFGNGALLTTAEEYGYEVLGLDLREPAVRLLREFGFEARCAELAQLRTDRPFDVISLADVLEHMPFPKETLGHARRLLGPGGILFVSTPNLDSFLWKALDHTRQNPYWAELEHFHIFGRRRLYALLAECGFTPCRFGISQRYLAGMEVMARKTEV